ncbi:hypothetical protein [Legionella fairfieldensis]|uniref:hypothetical protein n=1 Tax=Legionella fairfieldensis TaxID=45064 RepID=UPI00048CD398|nr:hypothetical protein [Legionella fairfieldensis]
MVSTKKKWTVGFVNFHTNVYLKWQFKILYEFNDPKDFDVILVDNSSPFEKQALESLKNHYGHYNNISIIYNDQPIPDAKGSAHHALGIELIMQHLNSDYLLIQDPDFFWVVKHHLKILESYFKKGYIAIGAPYKRPVGFGDPTFPTAFGCAYKVSELKKDDFLPLMEEAKVAEVNELYPHPQFDFSGDVGWKIRQRLSPLPFISFSQHDASELTKILGDHSFECAPCEYLLEGKMFAFHLFRGSFPMESSKLADSTVFLPPKAWVDVRRKYAKAFYNITKNPLARILFQLKREFTNYRYQSQLLPLKHQIIFMQNYKYKQTDIIYMKKRLSEQCNYLMEQIKYIKNNTRFIEINFTESESNPYLNLDINFFNIKFWKIRKENFALFGENTKTAELIPIEKLFTKLDEHILNLSHFIGEIQIKWKLSNLKEQTDFINSHIKFVEEKIETDMKDKEQGNDWLKFVSLEQPATLMFKNSRTHETLPFIELLHQLDNEITNQSKIIQNIQLKKEELMS